MQNFDFHRPQTLAEAVSILAEDEGAKLLAGGQTLLPTMKQGLATPSALVALRAIPGLTGIRACDDGSLEIGAMTCHADVAASPLVQRLLPGLAALANKIADRHVRNRGTLGGSIANCDPAADYPAALLALDATIVTDRREIPADEFFAGLFTTALEDREIVTTVRFAPATRVAYAKFSSPASRYAIVGVAVAASGSAVRVAVTGAGADGLFRWEEAEAALTRDFSPEALGKFEPDPDMLNGDMHASPAYRASLTRTMTIRAVRTLLSERILD
ncbi:Carbon monoxide dehydrogenase medium chain [Ensifer psoraleae]|uniref:FAD binding domain-containing protein n=1 Tax=Sinorhizobium psoraleae TaxID=520838 RepID=UPI001568F6DE|nr:xanthine dehydrogenase family protein subunit M [Sinorhizobium psoraleae]NRP72148.1 Carbon monoxide dehydrogenase medium chain [Sinorhizobium psoraleae]